MSTRMSALFLPSIAPIARSQHGLISIAQLAELGVGTRQRETLVRHGILVPEVPRVYSMVGAPRSVARDQTAGLLSLGPPAVLSFECAARVHEFDRARSDVVEFTVPRSQRSPNLGFRVHSTIVLPDIDCVTIDGWRCTSATRTIIDLAAARIGRVRLEAAIDSAIRSEASSPALLAERLDALRGPGRHGVRLLAGLLEDTGGHTMLERRFLQLMRIAGLPRPSTQVIYRRDGRPYARVDFSWEDAGIVVEVSGRKGHSSPAERARDAQRRNELQDAGRRVYEYTWEDVTTRSTMVIRTMRERYASGLRARVG